MKGRGSIVLAVLAVIAVLALVFFFFIKPRRAELAQVKADIEAEESRTVQLEAERDRLLALAEDAPRLRAQLEKVRAFVPQKDNVPNFIFQVQQAANASGLAFVKIAPEVPEPPVSGAQLAEIRVQLGADGGYFAIQDFIRRLYALDRALRIDILNLAVEEDSIERGRDVVVDMEGTARIFFELPPGSVTGAPGTTTPTTTTTPAPGASPTPGSSPVPTTTPGG